MAGRRGAVVEDVAEVQVGVLGADLGAGHEELAVRFRDDVRWLQRTREARPAGAGFELIARAEKRLAADGVHVNAGGVSGGCLEEYIANVGERATRSAPVVMLHFSTHPDSEDNAPVLGCGGSIDGMSRLTAGKGRFARARPTTTGFEAMGTGAGGSSRPSSRGGALGIGVRR